MKRREPVQIIYAIALYRIYKSSRLVARIMRRSDGSHFTSGGIWAAVRRHDRRSA